MRPEHLYAIVDHQGGCWRIVGRGNEKADLPALLAEGWRPVRETAFALTNHILICLEREPEGQVGFGFGR